MSWSPVIEDSFTDAHGTALVDHSPDTGDASSWELLTGTLEVFGNQIGGGSSGGDDYNSTAIADDQAVQLTPVAGAAQIGVLCRVTPNSGSDFDAYQLWKFSVFGTTIYRLDSGSKTELDTDAAYADSGDEMRLEVTGDSLVGLINGTPVVSATDGTYASGYVGMTCSPGAFQGDDYLAEEDAGGGGGPFTATAAVTIGAVTCSAAATFEPGTKTATAAVTIGAATCAASATFSPGIKTASADVMLGGRVAGPFDATSTGSGTIVVDTGDYAWADPQPVIAETTAGGLVAGRRYLLATLLFGTDYNQIFDLETGDQLSPPSAILSLSPAADSVSCAAAATFVPGTKTATAAVSVGAATCSASATFSAGDARVGTAAVTVGNATCSAAATFSPGTKTATATVTAGAATCAASASFGVDLRTATAAVTTGAATCAASATFAAGSKTATAAVTIGHATCAASATFSAGTKTASASLSTAPAVCDAAGLFNSSVFSAAVSLSTPTAWCAALANFVEGEAVVAATWRITIGPEAAGRVTIGPSATARVTIN